MRATVQSPFPFARVLGTAIVAVGPAAQERYRFDPDIADCNKNGRVGRYTGERSNRPLRNVRALAQTRPKGMVRCGCGSTKGASWLRAESGTVDGWCEPKVMLIAKSGPSAVAVNLHSPVPAVSLLGLAVLYIALIIRKAVINWADRRNLREGILPLGLGLDLCHYVSLIGPHPLHCRRSDEVSPLNPLQQGGVAFGFLLGQPHGAQRRRPRFA